jgi:Uma2 family endonuclease
VADVDETDIGPGFRPPPRGEDLPYSDGEPMESQRHVEQMLLLIESLGEAWRDRDDFFVGGNMFVYFSELQAKKNDFRGPDVFVVMDTTRKERKSWVVWEEDGKAPDVVIELVSASTERVDRVDKMRLYAKLLRVAEYYIFDPFTGRLDGFELDPSSRSFRPREPDADGRIHSRATGLSLGVVPGRHHGIEAPWLRWIDPDGAVLPTGAERAAHEEARAAQAEARATAALGRVEELERRLGRT